jgi:hypothetical protein
MWIVPRAVILYTKGMFWTVVQCDGPLQILKQKSTGTFMDGVLSTVRSVNPLNIEKHLPPIFRLVFNNRFDGNSYVLAASDSEEVILRHWNQVRQVLIPQLFSQRDVQEK